MNGDNRGVKQNDLNNTVKYQSYYISRQTVMAQNT